MTRVVEFSEHGGPDVLRIEAESPLGPGPNEVRVRKSVIALSRANTMFRAGTYLSEATFPSRIGAEGVGAIDDVGANVSGRQVGQRVNLLPPANESSSGYAADFNTVPQDRLLPAPAGLNDRQAATAWVPFLTIYHLFVEREWAAGGKWIVLPAASSSVALAANSLARHLGAKTIGITRTRNKQGALEAAGYDALVFSEDKRITKEIKEIAADGVDLFLPFFDSGALAPVADEREFSLDQIGDAFRYLESNTQFGKVTVTV